MASALNFAGYEFDYKWDRGTHSIYYGTRAYPDAMRWLWRGWPAKVQAGESMNGTIKSLLVKGEQWQETSAFPAQPAVDAKEISKHVKNYSRVLNLQNGDKYISNTDGEIYFLKKGAKKSVKMNTLPLSGREIAIYPNGKLLVASEKNSNWLISYLIDSDGSLHSGQQFYWLHNTDNHNHTPYGNITFDTQGNLYIATPIGIQVCDQNGRVRAILPLPEKGRAVEEIAFVGNKLYARCGGKIYVRVVAHTGHNCWDAPIEVKSQGQG